MILSRSLGGRCIEFLERMIEEKAHGRVGRRQLLPKQWSKKCLFKQYSNSHLLSSWSVRVQSLKVEGQNRAKMTVESRASISLFGPMHFYQQRCVLIKKVISTRRAGMVKVGQHRIPGMVTCHVAGQMLWSAGDSSGSNTAAIYAFFLPFYFCFYRVLTFLLYLGM